MLKKATLILLAVGMTALAACNTVEGVGRDIESVGRTGKEVMK